MLKIEKFPEHLSTYDMNPSELKECLFAGFFQENVTVDGAERIFYTYLTPGLTYDRNCLVVAVPDEIPVMEFVENNFWLDFAAREKVFLHFVVPEQKWKMDGTDADYMNRVYIEIQSRKYYVTIQDNIYAFGFGNGAVIAQQAVMKMTSEWSGVATFGEMNVAALLNQTVTQEKEATGKTELVVSSEKSQLPVWMFWKENSGENAKVCSYWKEQNHVEEERFSNPYASEIYFPSTIQKKSQVNEEMISQVRISNGFTGDVTEEVFAEVWKYISKARRHRCFAGKALRNYKDPIAYGATLHKMEVDGYTRIWYEYVPDSVKESKEPVSLVVNMHGRGGSAESFMDISCMNQVAEERNFIVVFPEASVHQQRPDGIRNVLLWQGSYRDEKIDDVKFILKLLADVEERYPVDKTRVYACGQSSGGMMTNELATKAPELFAAAAPWSAIISPDEEVCLPEQICPTVPYLFLFGENDWLCVDRENGQMEYKVTESIAKYLQNLIQIYGLSETPLRYQCGEISYYVYNNKDNVPLLTVGTVKDMSHANYPGESWITYDEFFSKFSKGEDGTLFYMGKEV